LGRPGLIGHLEHLLLESLFELHQRQASIATLAKALTALSTLEVAHTRALLKTLAIQ
jgi:hypothetical protein